MTDVREQGQLFDMLKKLVDERSGELCDVDDVKGWFKERHYTVYTDVVENVVRCERKDGVLVPLDSILTRAWVDLRKERKGVTKELIACIIDEIARENRRNLWLEGIPEWDGKDRWTALFRDVIRHEPPYGALEWSLGLVGMQIEREALERAIGTWRPPMLILTGPQGHGKDWLLSQLGGMYTGVMSWDGVLDGDRDAVRRMKRCVLAIIDEDPTAHGRAMEGVKALITCTKLASRAMYARYDDADSAFVTTLAGTTNSSAFLRDQTGSRRFVVVDASNKARVMGFNFPQLLGQFVHLYTERRKTVRFPWVLTNFKRVNNANAKFSFATLNLFIDLLDEAVRESDGTLRSIRNNLIDKDARMFFFKGRSMQDGLESLGYVQGPDGRYTKPEVKDEKISGDTAGSVGSSARIPLRQT